MIHPPVYKLYYLQIPPQMARDIGAFVLDPKIPLPVEGKDTEVPVLTELSWEQIVAGMLKIMAWERTHKDFIYYRDFILAVRPQVFQELSSTGIVKAQEKEFSLAEEVFLALEGLDPENPRTQLNLALMYDEMAEDFSKRRKDAEADDCLMQAQKRFSKALTSDPSLPDAFFYAGFFHLKQKNLTRAKALFETFFELSKDEEKLKAARRALGEYEKRENFDRLFKEAYDFILLGKEEEAILRINEFLKEDKGVWNAWFLLGWAERRLQHWDSALEAFNVCLEKGGETVDVLNEIAICEMEKGDLKKARKVLEQALRLDPESTKILSNLGVLALKLGDKEEAKGFFEVVLDTDPEDPVAQQWLKELN